MRRSPHESVRGPGRPGARGCGRPQLHPDRVRHPVALEHWAPTSRFDLTGRVVVITGATSGLGLSAARALAAAGASVEIIGRDTAKSAAVCARLRAKDPSADVGFLVADMGDLGAVRRVCGKL